MTGQGGANNAGRTRFRAEPAALRLGHDLGLMTLIYHRRSGITHMVSEPVPQILEALDALGTADAAAVARHLLGRFDVQADDDNDPACGPEDSVETVIAARLEELAALGLVLREAA
ncbi:MAG TPA: HPr-rel-A system PqqD family peptide chaperone [Sphingobium sp.]